MGYFGHVKTERRLLQKVPLARCVQHAYVDVRAMTVMAGALPSAAFGFLAALIWRDQSRDRAEQEAVRREGVGKSRLGGSITGGRPPETQSHCCPGTTLSVFVPVKQLSVAWSELMETFHSDLHRTPSLFNDGITWPACQPSVVDLARANSETSSMYIGVL